MVDPWFGRDKALHFGASFALAVGGYAAASWAFERRAGRVALSASIAIGAGVAKEIADYQFKGDPSARDLAWDAIGTAAGVLVAWAIDRAISPRHFAIVRSAAPDGPFAFVVTSQCSGF